MELLYIRHPDKATHEKQISFLETLPEQHRSQHAQLFLFGNAAMHYYQREEPTEDDFNHWLEGLPEPISREMKGKGYQYCKTTLSLRRHSLERRDVGMTAFVKELLNEEDFNAWEKAGHS